MFSFCLARLRKHTQPREKCTDEILLQLFYIIEYLKGLTIAVWPKKCAKLSKDGELMLKKDVHLLLS